MRKLKKATSIILLGAMLLYNSSSLVAYANERITESDLVIQEENTDNKTKDATFKETDDTKAPVLDVDSLQVDKKELKGGETVKISVKVTDDKSGVHYVSVSYYKPVTGENKYIDMSYNSKSGRYEGSLYIKDTMEAGIWKIDRLSMGDKEGNYTSVYNTNTTIDNYWSTKEDLSAGDFKVVGTSSDIEAPVLDISSLQVDKKELKGGETVKISAKITDDKSAVENVSVSYYKPITGKKEYIGMSYNSKSGRYEGNLYIEDAMEAGIWKIDSLSISDIAGNHIQIYNSNTNTDDYVENKENLSGGDFKVVGTSSDIEAPVLDVSSLQVDKKELKGGETVKISAKITDEKSGVGNVSLNYYKPITGENEYINMSYNSKSDRYEGTLYIEDTMEAGIWKIHTLEMSDTSGNYIQICNSNTVDYGNTKEDLSGGDFEVVGTSSDIEAPVLDVSSLQVDKKELKGGETVKISAKITDDKSGVDDVSLRYYKPITGENEWIYMHYNDESDRYEGSLYIRDTMEAGIWKIKSLGFGDKAGNYKSIYNTNTTMNEDWDTKEDLSGGDFEIVGTSSDIEAPVLDISSLQVDKKEVNIRETVKISAKITDDKSGVDYVSVVYCKPIFKDDGTSSVYCRYIEMYYNDESDRYEGWLYINDSMEKGMWKIENIGIGDNEGHNLTVYNSNVDTGYYGQVIEDLSAGDFNVNESNIDITPPEFKSISVDKKTVKPGDKATISVEMVDDKSGINLDYFNIMLDSQNYNELQLSKVVYNEETEKYDFTVEINGTMPNGAYSISQILVADNEGNYANINDYGPNPTDLSDANFEVVESINDYKDIIKSVKIDNNRPKVGDTLNISVELANNSHISNVMVDYYLDLGEYRLIDLKYNKTTNRYEGQLTIDDSMETGIWLPEHISFMSNNDEWINGIHSGEYGLVDKFKFEVVEKENETTNGVVYRTHVEDYGWQEWKSNGEISGTSGEAKRLEAIEIKADNLPEGASIKYRTHVEDYGWQEWKSNGQMSGTSGEAKRLEAIEIKLENAPGYSVQYRTHVEDYGWQEWKSDGEISGTSGEAKRLEAIEIRIVKNVDVEYRTHVEDYGWQGWKNNGEMSGTSGEAKRLEAIEIKTDDLPKGAIIKYRTHVEDYGWQEWKNNGEMSGTSGEAKRLEGIEIKLENAPGYSVEYRTHVEDYGWQEWKSDGEMSGTSGQAKRLEAIEVRIVKE